MPTTGTPPPLRLSDALTMFYQEMKREKRWSERTQFKERDKFELFQAIIDPDGSLPVAMIGAEHMRLYKRTMYGLPKGRNNKKEYSAIPLQDLIRKAQEELIPERDRFSPRTIGNHCIQIATFINWAGKNEYHNNPKITGLLHVAKAKQDHENRDPYNRDDLTRIFAPADFLTSGLTRGQGKRQKNKTEYSRPDSGGRASRFWVPLLGLFTGARIEELSQLHLSDVAAVDREGNARSLFTPGEEQPLGPEALLEQIETQQETLCVFIYEGDNQSIKTEGSKL